jgi:hypothetical protein
MRVHWLCADTTPLSLSLSAVHVGIAHCLADHIPHYFSDECADWDSNRCAICHTHCSANYLPHRLADRRTNCGTHTPPLRSGHTLLLGRWYCKRVGLVYANQRRELHLRVPRWLPDSVCASQPRDLPCLSRSPPQLFIPDDGANCRAYGRAYYPCSY